MVMTRAQDLARAGWPAACPPCRVRPARSATTPEEPITHRQLWPRHRVVMRGGLPAHGQVFSPERRSRMSESTASGTVVAQLVETLRTLAGSHPGFRPAHAKGIVCSGTFRGASEARRVSRAPHLQGQAVPTV